MIHPRRPNCRHCPILSRVKFVNVQNDFFFDNQISAKSVSIQTLQRPPIACTKDSRAVWSTDGTKSFTAIIAVSSPM